MKINVNKLDDPTLLTNDELELCTFTVERTKFGHLPERRLVIRDTEGKILSKKFDSEADARDVNFRFERMIRSSVIQGMKHVAETKDAEIRRLKDQINGLIDVMLQEADRLGQEVGPGDSLGDILERALRAKHLRETVKNVT